MCRDQNCSETTYSSFFLSFIQLYAKVVRPQPFYFPDLCPSDFSLCPKLKPMLTERCFNTVGDKNKLVKDIARHFKRDFLATL